MATFPNFALKIDRAWAKVVVQPILETRMPMMFAWLYDLFILEWKENEK